MMRLPFYRIFTSLITVCFISACGSKESKTAPAPIPVRVLEAANNTQDSSQQAMSYSATVEPGKGIVLSFQVSGTITQVLADAGQAVKKGQLLATVDEAAYRDQYNAVRAQQKKASDSYERVSQVYQKGSIAEVKLVEARSGYEQATAMAAAAYQNVKHCRLYAPESGYVGRKMIEAGATAAAGMPAFEIVKINDVKVSVSIPESESGSIRKGDRARVFVPALGKSYSGTADEVGIVATSSSHAYDVKISIPNKTGELKPGMTCQAWFDAKRPFQATEDAGIAIPTVAVSVDEKGTNFVYVVNPSDSTALRKNVKTGELLKDAIVITSGISRKDLVITSGYHKITNGTRVRIIK